MFKGNRNQVFAYKNNVIKNQKMKEEIIESIQRNVHCSDFLENLEKHYEDVFKYSGKREDEIELEKVKWIHYQIDYNIDLFYKSLKKLGGKVSDVKPFEWK